MPEEGPRATRRAVLRHGLFAIGALAGVAGLTGIAGRLKSGSQVPAHPVAGSTLELYGSDWSLAAPGLTRGDLPKRGDVVSVSGVLRSADDPELQGSFFASVMHLDGTAGHGPYSAVQLETHTFQLPGGNLIGMGTSTAGGENVFAIVGGTGRFLGVTGSYVAKQSPLQTGGDGTAEFIFTFNSGR